MDEELRKIQERIAKRVILRDSFRKMRLFAGFDVSYKGSMGICYGVVVDKSLEMVEKKIFKGRINFPYVPGFFAFREGPLIISTYKSLENKPDIILIDGNGIIHPMRAGIASHVGVILNKSTIGVAKKLLLGKCKIPEDVGKAEEIKLGNSVLGFALLTKKNCNPIYISPGHKVSLGTALKIVKSLTRDKIPEPLRMAHQASI
jgi:deoxyribonuclease V